jgi:hypothetical protein
MVIGLFAFGVAALLGPIPALLVVIIGLLPAGASPTGHKAPSDSTRLRRGWSRPALREVSYTPFNPKQDRYYRELLASQR